MATQFEINGSAPSPASAKPPGEGGLGCMIIFPESGQDFRGDGHSITIGKPYVHLKWPIMPSAGAAYWYGLNASDTTPSKALTSCSAYNPRTGTYTTYSGTIILHRPKFGGVYAGGGGIWYTDFEVLITELS